MVLKSRGLPRSRGKVKTSISTATMLMATKLSRDLTYHEGLPPITSYGPSKMWSFEVT